MKGSFSVGGHTVIPASIRHTEIILRGGISEFCGALKEFQSGFLVLFKSEFVAEIRFCHSFDCVRKVHFHCHLIIEQRIFVIGFFCFANRRHTPINADIIQIALRKTIERVVILAFFVIVIPQIKQCVILTKIRRFFKIMNILPLIGFYSVPTFFVYAGLHIKAFRIIVLYAVQKICQTFLVVVRHESVVEINVCQVEVEGMVAEAQSLFVPLYGFGNVFQFFIV